MTPLTNKTDPSLMPKSYLMFYLRTPSQSWKGLLKVSSQCRYLSLSLGLGRSFSRSRTDSNPRPIWYFSSTSIFRCIWSLAWARHYYPVCRFTPRALTSRPTRGLTRGRSPTCAAGRDVTGSLPDLTSSPGIIANTPAANPSNVICATELLLAVITWACTWRDIRPVLDFDQL